MSIFLSLDKLCVIKMFNKVCLMLKTKSSIAILTLPLFIAACGGGGGNSDSKQEINNSSGGQNTSQVFFDSEKTLYAYEVDDSGDSQYFDKNEISIKDGILYEKSKKPVFSPFYLTKEGGLYEPETEQTYNANLGIKESFIFSVTPTKWVTIPYNKAGLRDLKFTRNFKVIDLEGTQIAEQLAPAAVILNDLWLTKGLTPFNQNSFVVKLGGNKDTFAKGSKCIQTQSVSVNSLFFEFDTTPTSKIEGVRNLQEWAELEKVNGNTLRANPVIENWKGINVGGILLDGINQSGTIKTSGRNSYIFALEYQGNVYQTTSSSGEWTIDDFLNELRQELKNDNSYSILANALSIEEADDFVEKTVSLSKNTCSYYNPVAAKNIDTIIMKSQ
ncbi:hypothetical protein OH685_04335 [Acinetobacter pittii]|nr:hypothetical protein OH685_04335 [Acinetobacter pittii]